jgi:hypothetical protein
MRYSGTHLLPHIRQGTNLIPAKGALVKQRNSQSGVVVGSSILTCCGCKEHERWHKDEGDTLVGLILEVDSSLCWNQIAEWRKVEERRRMAVETLDWNQQKEMPSIGS